MANQNTKKILAVVLAVIVLATLTALDYFVTHIIFPNTEDPNQETVITLEGLSIHFLELGNKAVGDSVYINYGDTDILIDAGSSSTSASTINAYLNKYVADGTLEYVIATHNHQDHVGAFGGTSGVFNNFDVDVIIDFPRTASSSNAGYRTARDNLVDTKGTKHYTALECYNNTGDAQRIWEIDEGIELEILYNPYYSTSYVPSHSNENNFSVCVMLRQGTHQYLFTGDLEKVGEDALVDYYNTKHDGLGHCTLYKGGHHGSSTSSNPILLAEITPDVICICTCAGTTQYTEDKTYSNPNTFPTQQMLDRIAPYTDKVYITSLLAGVYTEVSNCISMNGNIIFMLKDGVPTIEGSNNNTKLKDTQWFKTYRTTPDAWAS